MKQKLVLVFILLAGVLGGVYGFKISNSHHRQDGKFDSFYYVFSYTTSQPADSVDTGCVYPGSGCLTVDVPNKYFIVVNGKRVYLAVGTKAKFP